MRKLMVINTNTEYYPGTNHKTGLWIGELVHFYDVFNGSDIEVDIYSVDGSDIPIDPLSTSPLMLDALTKSYMEDAHFMAKLKQAPAFTSADISDYDGVYFTGGHGVMFDFPDNMELKQLIARMDKEGKVIASVCHGTAALLNVEDEWLKDRSVAGFSNMEEKLAGKTNLVPFLLETELKKSGAKYEKALLPYTSKVVVDKNVITGQNPQSPKGVGKAVLKYLQQ
ncbi:Molecular chaperone Hsp31 and glyoxalase 3 [Macrococcoides canis]|uniref:Molecular chaperone Hsp31 and glyoxalase 3 n=1 Tax=Macrococcoides canis TaxID=1855823 RepID=A0A1W7A8Y8_9STAP|nr:type 1 glutamine amidotransferase domain-containing protein [Macrococcus canis]ARQ06082.1 Molecular chaperone Hsp31 and glyoxalase 3 [Macrococcus canis]